MPATSLTLSLSNFPSTLATTANRLFVKGGSSVTSQSYTTIGNNVTGWGEVTAQGAASGWAASGSIGNPTGKGFFLDSAFLSGSTILAGNWTPSLRLNAAQGAGNPQAGTLTGDIVMRVYKYTAGTYTLIVSSTLTAQSVTSVFTTYTLPSVSGSVVALTNEDRLYLDIWFNCTANANANGTQGIRLNRLSTDTTGLGDVASSIASPGYFSSKQDLASRFHLALIQDNAQSTGRGSPNAISPASDGENYTLAGTATWAMSGSKIAATTATGASYAILGSTAFGDLDALVRFNVSSTTDAVGIALRYTDANNHYRVRYGGGNFVLVVNNAGTSTNLATTAFTMNTSNNYSIRARAIGSVLLGKIWQDTTIEPTSFQLAVRDTTFTSGNVGLFANLNVTTDTILLDRFVVTNAFPNRPDIPARVRMAAQGQKDLAGRVRMAAQQLRDIATRFALLAQKTSDLSLRFLLSASLQRVFDLAGRVLVAARQVQNISLRFCLLITRQMDVASRLLLRATTLRDIRTRLALFITVQWNTATRVRIAAQVVRSLSLRFFLAGLAQRDLPIRFLLFARRVWDLPIRVRLSVLQIWDIWARVRLLVSLRRDLAVRLRLAGRRIPDLIVRLVLRIVHLTDVVGRVRLSAGIIASLPLRFSLLVLVRRDLSTRLALLSQTRRDWQFRVRFSVLVLRTVPLRVKFFVTQIADVGGRLILSRAVLSQIAFLPFRLRLQGQASKGNIPLRFVLSPFYSKDMILLPGNRTAPLF